MSDATSANPIDEVMERASAALESTSYFSAATLCLDALRMARARGDYERLSRICLPLQEARRQIRQLAVDAGPVRTASTPADLPDPLVPGCYLLSPPFVGVDGAQLARAALEAEAPVFVLVREPTTRAGLVPVVGVGARVVRVRIGGPEAGAEAEPGAGTNGDGSVPMSWFIAAGEALGDQAIADAESAWDQGPAAHLVDDLLERLDAAPEHEKLLQRLAQAAADAALQPPETARRRRPIIDDPTSF